MRASWQLLAAKMRQIGAGEAEGDYGLTTIKRLKICLLNNKEKSGLKIWYNTYYSLSALAVYKGEL